MSESTPLSCRRSFASAVLVAAAFLTPALDAAGLPSGGRVDSGSANLSQVGSSLVIQQSSQHLRLAWDSFSIAAGSSVTFQQPSSSSLAVNLVGGGDASVIAGNLSANGRVVLVNPRGIAFTGTAQVNVGSLVASALRDASGDFSSGRSSLSGPGGEVSNAGVITVATEGSAVLAGARVTNTGHILADAGRVALAAGSHVSLDYSGDGLIRLSVEAGAVDAEVSNGGAIRVGSGHILLTAKSADTLAASVVRNSGELQASGLVERGGEIWLTADVVASSGTVTATSAVGQGGEAHLVGRQSVSVTGTVDVSGGAKGGFVDVSAPAVLLPDIFQIKVGRGGHFLLDPDNIIIDAVGSPIAGDPTLSDPATDITLSKFSIETWLSGGSDLTIDAIGDITVQSSITVVAPGAGGLTLDAGGSIDIQQPISTTGALTLDAGADVDIAAALTSSSLAIIAVGDLSVGDDILTTAGDLDFQVGGDLILDNLGGTLTIQSFADVNPVIEGDVLTNIPLLFGGTEFVLLTDGGAATFAQGWIVSDVTSKVLTLSGDVQMQYGFSSGFALPTAEQLAFVPADGVKYPDPYLNEDVDAGLQDGDTIGDVFSFTNLSLAWDSGAPTATSAVGSSFGYSLTVGPGLTVDSPGYVVVLGQGTGTLSVRPRELLVKADDTSGTYGNFPTPPKYFYQVTGFQNGHTSATLGITGEAVLSSTYDSTLTANRGAGSYDITVLPGTLSKSGVLSGNYAFNYQPGDLVIAKAPLTLTADDKTRDYGDANPELTITPLGLAYDDTVATALTGTLSLTTAAIATTDVGQYVIDLSQGTAASANYDVTLADGSLTITKAPLTITMEDDTKVYGDPLAAGYAYVMSGFKNSETEAGLRGSAALSGLVLYATSATQASSVGTYTLTPLSTNLTATNYSFTNLVPGVLTITPRGLVVSASPTREYGLANDPTNITWNTVITNFAPGDTQVGVITGEPALIGLPDIDVNAGTYAITLGQGTLSAGPNYDLTAPTTTYNPADFTITPATSLRFVADDQTREYGLANPTFTWTVSGFRNDDTSAVLSGSPLLSTTATTLTGVGTRTITIAAGSLAAANYTVNLPENLVNGTLTITKAPLTVAAISTSRSYGDANPTLTALISGYRNGQNLATSGVTGAPSLTTDAIPSSTVGSYDILATAGTLASANYSFSFFNGTLTVTKAPLTVTANNASREYGSADTFAGYVISGFKNSETEAGLRDISELTGEAALTTDALLTSNVESNAYLVQVSKGTLAATNYDFDLSSYVNAVYDITKATLTVTASSKSREYGDPNPGLEYTLSGFKIGTETTLGDIGTIGLPVLATTVTQSTGIGVYDVTVTLDGMSSVNYDFTPVAGTLTVTRAPLTLAVQAASSEYGSDFAGFTLLLSAFKNGETESALRTSGALSGSGVFTYTNAEVKLLNVAGSPYTVGVTGLGTLLADNYSFTLPATTGALTITPAPLTLRAKDVNRTYGTASTQAELDDSWDIVGLKNGETRDGLLNAGAVTNAPSVSSTQALDALTNAGTYTGVIAVTNGTFAVNPTGNYTFDISSTPSAADLVVGKAVLTVGVDGTPLSKVYGEALPTFTPTYSNFVNGQDLASSGVTGSPSLSTTATASSNVGSYTVTVNVSGLSAANYSFTANNGTLNVTKAPLTVSADAKTREYGLSNPTLTATLTGFVLGQNLATSGVTGSSALSTTATPTSSVAGSPYTITVGLGTLASSNYDFTAFNNSTLTITKAPLTLVADPKDKTYGDLNPTLTYTVSGLRQADTDAVILGGSPSLSTTVTQLTGAGTYAGAITVDATGLSADNYNIGVSAATFTVQKALLLGTVDAATRTYGFPNPAFAVTWTGYKNSDTAVTSGFTGSLAFSTDANPASPVAGSPYTVAAAVGTYSSPNYTFGAITSGLLTIERGNLWENEFYNLAAAPLAAAIRLGDIQARMRGQPLNLDPQARIDFDKLSIRLLGVPSPESDRDSDKSKNKVPANALSSN